MPRAAVVCSCTGCAYCDGRCPRIVDRGRCAGCRTQHRRESDRRRPNATDRGYGPAWRSRRDAFLAAHPYCTDCGKRATVADHDPISRVELVRRGDPDPDAARHLKPRCTSCHNTRTAHAEPGGWNR